MNTRKKGAKYFAFLLYRTVPPSPVPASTRPSSWHHIAHQGVVHEAQENQQQQAPRGNGGPADQAKRGRSHCRRAAPQHQLRFFTGGRKRPGGGNDVRWGRRMHAEGRMGFVGANSSDTYHAAKPTRRGERNPETRIYFEAA